MHQDTSEVEAREPMAVVEFRTYRLHPGASEAFLALMTQECLPLLRARGIDVLACGLTCSREDGREEAILIRAFLTLAEHDRQEAEFYSSEAWAKGPRDRLLACIQDYHSVTLLCPASSRRALTELGTSTP